MSDQNTTDVVLRTKIEGIPDSLQSLDLLKAKIESLNGPVASGSQSNLPSGAPAWAPVPPIPYLPQDTNPNQFQPMAGGPIPGTQAYAGGSGALMPPYVPPGYFAPKPDPGGSGAAAGGALVPYDPDAGGNSSRQWNMHVDTMNVIAQTVNIIGQTVNMTGGGAGGAGGFGGGVPGGGVPGMGGGFGPGPFNVNPPPVPAGGAGGPSWQNFAQVVMRNPSLQGITGAIGQQMPLGSVALISAAASYGNWMADQELAEFRPQYQYETQLQATREGGHFVHPYIAAAESKAAQGEAVIARERAALAPFMWIPILHQDAEMKFMEQQRQVELLRARGQSDVSLAHLSGITGIPVSAFPRHFDDQGRQVTDPTMADYRVGGAEMVGPFGSAASSRFIPLPTGAENEAILKFGQEGGLRAVGAMASAAMDPTRSGIRGAVASGASIKPSATLDGGVLSNAQMAASKGDLQTLYALLPFFDAANQHREWENLVSIARQMMDTAGLGVVAAQTTRLATISGASGATVVGDIHAQIGIETGKLNELIAAQQAAPENMKGDYNALILQQRTEVQQLRQQGAQTYYGRREQELTAQGMEASTTQQRLLYHGATGERAFAPIFAERSRVLTEQARIKEAESNRYDIYSPEQRAVFWQEARQLRLQAGMEIPREAASLAMGQSEALTGLHGAQAGFAGTVAGLFGGPSERAAAVGQQESVVAEHLKNIQDRLDKGFLLDTERNQLLTEQKNLQGQQVSLAQQRIRGELEARVGLAQGEAGIQGTERGTAFIRGVGGLPGEAMAYTSVERARSILTSANALVAGLRQQGVSEDNPAMIAARQGVASAVQGIAQSEEQLAHTPAPIAMRSALSSAGYRAQVLSMIPGSYGNMRGALQQEVSTLEGMAATKQAEYQKVVTQYGGEANVPDHVKFGFQQELQQLGLQQAAAAQQLAYGWESRLISQTIGTPGSFAMYANRFSFRDAVGAGVVNPHFGANRDQLPFFLRQAATVGSTAGSADPLGFAAGAMTGVRGGNGFSIGGVHGNNGVPHADSHGMPGVTDGGGVAGGAGTEEAVNWMPSAAAWDEYKRTGKLPFGSSAHGGSGTTTGTSGVVGGTAVLQAITMTNHILVSILQVMTGGKGATLPMVSGGLPGAVGSQGGFAGFEGPPLEGHEDVIGPPIAPRGGGAMTAGGGGMPAPIIYSGGTPVKVTGMGGGTSRAGGVIPYTPSPYGPHDPRFTSRWDGMSDPGAGIGPHDPRFRSRYDGMNDPGANIGPHDPGFSSPYDGMRFLKQDNFMKGGSHGSYTSPYDGTPDTPGGGASNSPGPTSHEVTIKWPNGQMAGKVVIPSNDATLGRDEGLASVLSGFYRNS